MCDFHRKSNLYGSFSSNYMIVQTINYIVNNIRGIEMF